MLLHMWTEDGAVVLLCVSRGCQVGTQTDALNICWREQQHKMFSSANSYNDNPVLFNLV